MAHEISIRENGLVEAMYANRPAWHGLGQVLDHAPSSAEAITAAHLDWEVRTEELRTAGGIVLPNHLATCRSDNGAPLGVVSGRYQIVQNREAFDFLDSLMMDGVMKYESAGALRGGRTIWLLARLPSVDYITPEDPTLRYVLFSSTHDGTGAIHAMPTSVRVVCANTLAVATAGRQGIRHTGDVSLKLQIARNLLLQCDRQFVAFSERAQLLASKQVARPEATQYIQTLFPEVRQPGRAQTIRANKIADLRQNFVNPRNAMPSIKGSWWALYNSVSEWVDHSSTSRGKDALARKENRMIAITEGPGAALKTKAFELACSMATAV